MVFTLVKNGSSSKVNAWWNKTTIGVVGQDNDVNFNKYDSEEPGNAITGHYDQIITQHIHQAEKDRRFGMGLSLIPSEFESNDNIVQFFWDSPKA